MTCTILTNEQIQAALLPAAQLPRLRAGLFSSKRRMSGNDQN